MKEKIYLRKVNALKEKKRNVYGLDVSPELEKKIKELMEHLGLTKISDLVRYAITKLYREIFLNEKEVA